MFSSESHSDKQRVSKTLDSSFADYSLLRTTFVAVNVRGKAAVERPATVSIADANGLL